MKKINKRKINHGLLAYLILMSSFYLLPLTFLTRNCQATEVQYFPLGIDTEWVFDSTDDHRTWTTRRYIDGWEFLGLQFVVHYNEEHDGVWENRMMLSKTQNSLVWWGFEDTDARLIAHNGLTYVVEPVVVGAQQGGTTTSNLKIKSTQQDMVVNFQGTYIIEALESVTVPAGTFDNCIRINELEVTPDGEPNFTVWYASNVGPVKFHYPLRDNRIDELSSFNIIDDDPFESWLLPIAPMLVIITLSVSIPAMVLIGFVILRKRRKRKAFLN